MYSLHASLILVQNNIVTVRKSLNWGSKSLKFKFYIEIFVVSYTFFRSSNILSIERTVEKLSP